MLDLSEVSRSRPATEWRVAEWLNSASPLSLQALRGKVVVLHAFQMLCPGCVQHGLPQAQRIHAVFEPSEVAVVGLHTVFEHHSAMSPVSLRAFIHEYRIAFPVGVDATGAEGPVPQTMQAYGLRGTPSLLLIDRQGRLRRHSFGAEEDMAVGAAIATLLAEG
ncbi:MAG: redoxin domain-containing protein [Betaproteobacteria bacterium]|nr:redoxin domain-containing protein [Betaproteobacteria bacterium]